MVFIPIKDLNRRIWVRYQFITLALIIACVAITWWQMGLTEREATRVWFGLGFTPAVLFGERALAPELVLVPHVVTPVTSVFLHGGWLHLIGNMLFLWVFGDNVEDAMGHRRFFVFFLICGIAGSLAHGIANPHSAVPLVGASGAVSGILGAYFVLHPRVRVWVLVLSTIPMRLRTWLVIGGWIGLNVINAAYGDAAESGVAWWAHVGGFAAGAVLIAFFKLPHVPLWDTSDSGHSGPRGLTLPSQRRRKDRK